MYIRTDVPILHTRAILTQKIAKFWDQISLGWQMVWGPHIHHGYYEKNAILTPLAAQEKLIDKLVDLVDLKPHANILDVGCGMGGSSLYLAEHYQAQMQAITLSSKQVAIAKHAAENKNIKTILFKVEDALTMASIPDQTFDIVWSLESCEQFYNKNLFLQHAYRVLKPGGKLILATWCSSREEYTDMLAKKYHKLCLAFDVPYMPTIDCYNKLIRSQGFKVVSALDWSDHVKPSWDIGISLLGAYSLLKILKVAGWRGLKFAKQVKLMQAAFKEERVRYGVFLATKPV